MVPAICLAPFFRIQFICGPFMVPAICHLSRSIRIQFICVPFMVPVICLNPSGSKRYVVPSGCQPFVSNHHGPIYLWSLHGASHLF
jgi:hypothetical protein